MLALDGPSLHAHERHLWRLCYRMTDSAADADDLVQETYARVLSRPAVQAAAPRAWLSQVAMNLARDLLRRRKRMESLLPWLPSGTESAIGGHCYETLESLSYALLLTLEALTARQRAVLLLRDVLDYSVQETAADLAISEANVRTIHLRARKAMRAWKGDVL